MFDWLFEGRLTAYLVLGVIAAALLALWWRDRRRHWLYGAGLVAALAGVYLLLDRAVETRQEQITRKLGEMAGAVEKGQGETILQHVSDRFNWEGMGKDGLSRLVRESLRGKRGQRVKAGNFQFQSDDEVRFQATAWDTRGTPWSGIVTATFGRDDDGQWRMRTMKVQPLTSTQTVGPGEVGRWAGQ